MPVKSEAEKSGGDAGTDLAAESATSGYGLTGLQAHRLTGPPPLGQTRLDMIDAAGRFCHLLGLPRSIGQIYGLLYLSNRPLNLDEIARALGIAKSSASMGTRQLIGWRVIKQLWIHGDRRDHFEADADLGNVLRAGYNEFLKPRMASSEQRLERISGALDGDLANGTLTPEEYDHCTERLRQLQRMQQKVQALLPLADQLF